MKPSRSPIYVTCLVAISLLFLGIFQACETMNKAFRGGDNPLVWHSEKLVPIKTGGTDGEKFNAFKRGLAHGKRSNDLRYCLKHDQYGIQCADVRVRS